MIKQDERFRFLLNKYLDGNCNEEELLLLETWYQGLNEDERKSPSAGVIDAAATQNWDAISKQITPVKHVKIWSSWFVAAAMLLIISAAMIFYWQKDYKMKLETRSLSSNDIAPGRNKAAILFTSGKVIELDNDQQGVIIDKNGIAYSDGKFAGATESTGTITAQTPRGGTYKLTLPDGTRVWLNNDTKLYFPASFNGEKRSVRMEGEAYFEVASSFAGLGATKHKRPFYVETKDQTIKVLGTHFNIEAYGSEDLTSTTLLEGKVEVITEKKKVMLSPGRQAITRNNQQTEVKDVDATQAVAWKDGDFLFNEEPLYSISKRLGRWYDVEVSLDQVDGNKKFTGKISRSKSLSSVLNMISKTSNISFKIEGRRVTAIAK